MKGGFFTGICRVGSGRKFNFLFMKPTDSPMKKFQLIDGTFSPEKARQVLGAMVQSKIDFHNLQMHSEWERAGRPEASSEERLERLKELDAELKELFKEAAAGGKVLEVRGVLEIRVKEG